MRAGADRALGVKAVWMIAVIVAVAGSARASADGVSTHTSFWPGTICGVNPPLSTRRLSTGLSELRLIKVM
jgi:hypothetical protein